MITPAWPPGWVYRIEEPSQECQWDGCPCMGESSPDDHWQCDECGIMCPDTKNALPIIDAASIDAPGICQKCFEDQQHEYPREA